MTTLIIPTKNIHASKNNPRLEPGDLTELAQSINEEGLLQNPRVRAAFAELGEGHYYLEAGWRRVSVALAKGIEELECSIALPLRPGETALERELVVGVSENGHRRGLHPIELANAFLRLRTECGMTQAMIAKKTGYHETTVNKYLSLTMLSKATQKKMREGKLSKKDALRIVRQHRAAERKKGGKPQAGVEWEPDYLCETHRLSRKARKLCEGLGHHRRRLIGDVACGSCWESVIRYDEEAKQKVLFEERLQFAKKQWMHDYNVQEKPGTSVVSVDFRSGA